MWTNPERLRRDLIFLYLATAVSGIIAAASVVIATPPLAILVCVSFVGYIVVLRSLMRCRNCKKSVLWWSVRHSPGHQFLSALVANAECPYCGFDDGGPPNT